MQVTPERSARPVQTIAEEGQNIPRRFKRGLAILCDQILGQNGMRKRIAVRVLGVIGQHPCFQPIAQQRF